MMFTVAVASAIVPAFLSFQPTKGLVDDAVTRVMAFQKLEANGDVAGRYAVLSNAYRQVISLPEFQAEEARFIRESGKPLSSVPKTVHFQNAGGANGSVNVIVVNIDGTYERETCKLSFLLVRETETIAINRVERDCVPRS